LKTCALKVDATATHQDPYFHLVAKRILVAVNAHSSPSCYVKDGLDNVTVHHYLGEFLLWRIIKEIDCWLVVRRTFFSVIAAFN
jgi:hypothetical protein